MPLYKCNNEKCPEYNQEKQENLHITYSKSGETDHKLVCPLCGEPRERTYEDKGWCTATNGRPNVCTK